MWILNSFGSVEDAESLPETEPRAGSVSLFQHLQQTLKNSNSRRAEAHIPGLLLQWVS